MNLSWLCALIAVVCQKSNNKKQITNNDFCFIIFNFSLSIMLQKYTFSSKAGYLFSLFCIKG